VHRTCRACATGSLGAPGDSPDGKTFAVVSIAANSVAFIDTATNRVKKIV